MKFLTKFQELVILIIGCFLMAFALNIFLEPHGIAPGGITGLAIVLSDLTHVPTWVINLICNIPLFIFAFKLLKKDAAKTFLGIVFLTLFLKVVRFNNLHITNDVLLSAVFGGVIMGISLGLIFRINGSTGGTDLLALIIHHFIPSINPPKLTGLADACIVVLSGVVTQNIEVALYSAIALFVTVKVSDMIVEGVHTSATFIIVSDKHEKIGEVVNTVMDRSATVINGTGFYTKKDKTLLFVAVSKREIVMFKKLIKQIDPNAFIMVTNNLETVGEGFKELQ